MACTVKMEDRSPLKLSFFSFFAGDDRNNLPGRFFPKKATRKWVAFLILEEDAIISELVISTGRGGLGPQVPNPPSSLFRQCRSVLQNSRRSLSGPSAGGRQCPLRRRAPICRTGIPTLPMAQPASKARTVYQTYALEIVLFASVPFSMALMTSTVASTTFSTSCAVLQNVGDTRTRSCPSTCRLAMAI